MRRNQLVKGVKRSSGRTNFCGQNFHESTRFQFSTEFIFAIRFKKPE